MRSRAVIIKGGEILLVRRIKNGEEYFVFPGGGAEGDEDPVQTLIREVREELGLSIYSPRFLFRLEQEDEPSCFFLVTKFSGEPVIGGEEKERMTPDNQYHVAWLPIGRALALPSLYPEEAKQKLAEILPGINRAEFPEVGPLCPGGPTSTD
ncbi:MAG: NUDIX domain-containing protein [Candidatus Liptonbacteria bacterium]|nr:NUDIX domain-containing protein [Candidatus Liptonbacteria bacterium]